MATAEITSAQSTVFWGVHSSVTSSFPSWTYWATAAGSIRQPLAKASTSTGLPSPGRLRPSPSIPC